MTKKVLIGVAGIMAIVSMMLGSYEYGHYCGEAKHVSDYSKGWINGRKALNDLIDAQYESDLGSGVIYDYTHDGITVVYYVKKGNINDKF